MNIMLDSHCHTIASGHAYSTLTECFEAASKKGLKALAITDHSPKMPGSTHEFYFANFRAIPHKLFGVEVLTGVELNIINYDGEVDLPSHFLKHLDVVIASLHVPCIFPGSKKQVTKAVVGALNNPYVKILGHLGDPIYPIDIKEVVIEAKRHNKVLEINEKSCDPNGEIRSGGYDTIVEIVKECVSQGVYMVIGGDSHFHEDIGVFDNALSLVERVNVPQELILNSDLEKFKEVIGISK